MVVEVTPQKHETKRAKNVLYIMWIRAALG